MRDIIRANRAKHGRWRLGPDLRQNRVVASAVKSWFSPLSHGCNKVTRQARAVPPGSPGWRASPGSVGEAARVTVTRLTA